MGAKILVVDDQANTLKVVGAILQDEGYEVFKAQNAREAVRVFRNQPGVDVVLADLKMPGVDGLELYRELKAIEAEIPFIIMTAHGTIKSAVEAMKEGVSNYLIKPLDYDELSIVLKKAISEKKISAELAELRREVREKRYFRDIVGTNPEMMEVFEVIRTAAPTDVSMLIKGETGAGKELLARAIHSLSGRLERPMVCINSAALTDSLLEAELFGHVKGAFTGATANKMGRLEYADKGTLFLDEIGAMSLNFQAKLLRFLQEGSFEPVGGVETRQVDVRVIAATNRDLHEEIAEGRFLRDLLYRLEVISITLPPLRERKEDIILLIEHFIKRFDREYGKDIRGVDDAALEALMKYPWPGNVRELENCVARAIILSKGSSIGVRDLPERIRDFTQDVQPNQNGLLDLTLPREGITICEMERELIEKTLDICNGNKTLSANCLGISRKALYAKMERYGIPV